MIETCHLSAAQLDAAVRILCDGGVVVVPTDTVYGVAVLARNAAAVDKLYAAKQRPRHQPLPVMVAAVAQVAAIAHVSPRFHALAARFWPGPITFVLPARTTLPANVTAGQKTVALRIPDYPLLLSILQQVDAPLAVTSANLSGQPPARTALEARAQLDGRVAAILDAGPAPGGQPSTLVDLTHPRPRILRPGPISLSQILSTPDSLQR